MPNILGMQDWNVLSRKQNEHDMVVVAEYTRPPSCCVRCGVTPPRLKKYGVQTQFFVDTPIHGKRAGIEIQRQRFQCLDCGKTFQQPLPDMDDKRTMTRRCLDYIRRLSLERTFTQVATDVGVNDKTVRNIFKALHDGMDMKQRRKLMHDRHLLLRRRRDLSGKAKHLKKPKAFTGDFEWCRPSGRHHR